MQILHSRASLREAVQAYVRDVKAGVFPDEALHGYAA